MTPVVTQNLLKFCPRCNFEGKTAERFCPRCRKPLQDEQQIRILGALLAFLGTLISGGMIALMILIVNTIANSHRYNSTTKWNGSPEDAKWIFMILGLVLAFGLAAAVAGLAHLLTGRRQIWLIKVMFGFGFLLWLIASAVRIFVE